MSEAQDINTKIEKLTADLKEAAEKQKKLDKSIKTVYWMAVIIWIFVLLLAIFVFLQHQLIEQIIVLDIGQTQLIQKILEVMGVI